MPKFKQKDLDKMIENAVNWIPPDQTTPMMSPEEKLKMLLNAGQKSVNPVKGKVNGQSV